MGEKGSLKMKESVLFVENRFSHSLPSPCYDFSVNALEKSQIDSLKAHLFSLCTKKSSWLYPDYITAPMSPLILLQELVREKFLRNFSIDEIGVPAHQHTVSWNVSLLGDLQIVHLLFVDSSLKQVR